MAQKTLPFTRKKILGISRAYPTPFHLYDESAMLRNARRFKKAFSILPGFREYFAVKATPNTFIMKLLREKEGFGADCSSMPELELAERVGMRGEEIMFSSNDTPLGEYRKAKSL